MYYTYNKVNGTNNYVILEEKTDATGIIVVDVNIYTYASTEAEAIRIVNRKNNEEE